MIPTSRSTLALVVALTAVAAPAGAAGPAGVSPGDLDRIAPVEGRCPTFSWTETDGAVGYQLVAYTLPADPLAEVELSPETQVLGRRLPPRATSWTPSADLCFAPGGAYVWFLRAVLEERDGDIVDASEWSEGLSFGVPIATAAGDDAAADTDASPADRRRDRPGGAPTRVGSAASAGKSGRSVATAPAAIRGDSVDGAGEVHGVIGTTASASGAGLAAANTAGGPDLVLDGVAQGLADTRISESGLDRSSAADQVFTIANSGAGGVTLAVDGAITGSGVGLTGLDAGNLATGTLPSARLAGSYSSVVSLSNTHNSFAGNGAGLINLNASSLAAGTLPSARLAGAYANALTLSNPGNLFTGDGSGLTNLDADTLGGVAPGDLWPGQSWGLYDATVADDVGNPGNGASIAIGADGLGIISHLGGSYGVLKVTHCNDLRCSAPTTVEHSQSAGDVTGIAIGSDGLAIISFQDVSEKDLRLAHCNDLDCSAATFTTVDSAGEVGRNSSIVTGQDGYGLISYVDSTNHSLKVAHCTNATCTTHPTTTVDGGAYDIGFQTCLTIGADGLPLIAYADITNTVLKVAHCSDADCGTATVSTADPAGNGTSCSITIGADGLGLISYLDGSRVKVAHCSNLLCSATTTAVIDDFSTGFAMAGTSITVGSDGRGVVSYYDPDSDNLKVAHCSDDACSTATAVDAKISGDVGWGSSIAIGLDGMPLIAYRYSGGNQLLVSHCSNRFCVPKARMR